MKSENRRILKAFAKHVLEEEFDVVNVVHILRTWEILNANESDRLENAVIRSERNNILLLEILPTKDDSAIDRLLNAVYKAGAETIAEYLLHLIDEGIPEETTAPPSLPTVVSTSSRVRTALKQQWNRGAGKQNLLFTGREEIMENVRQTFKSRNTAKTISAVCLSGTGGMGKSSIALEYSYREEESYTFIAWLTADSTGRFFEELEVLGETLGLPLRPNKKNSAASIETIQAVRNRLAETPGWFVVLDDMSEEVLEVLEESLPNSGGCILITSRMRISVDWITRVDVGELNESTELLGKAIGTRKPSDFEERKEELANEKLGRLPLAIMHAGSYIKQRSISVSSYLNRFEESAEILNKKLQGVRFQGPQQVLTTWNLTMDHLRKESEDSFRFLSICSFLASTIEDSIMCRAPAFKEQTARKTQERVEDAKVQLINFSMVNPTEDGVSVHVLVQEAVLFNSSFQENEFGFSNGVAIMEGLSNDQENSADPQPFRTCFAHSEAMINKFHRKFADQRTQVASCSLKYYYYKLSLPFFCSVLRLRVKVSDIILAFIQKWIESLFGDNSLETSDVIHNIAVVAGQQGDYNTKLGLLERVLKIQEPMLGKDHNIVAKTLHALGNCYGHLGDHLRNKELLERALQILTSFYGENHVEVATTLLNLGNCYGDLGDNLKMKEMLERALQIKTSFYGENHVEVAMTLNSLGICYERLGDNLKMKEMLERALQIEKSFYGENHVTVANTLINLGICHRSLKNYPQSLALLKQAVDIYERGFLSKATAYYLSNSYWELAISLMEASSGKDSLLEAKDYLEKELAILAENLDHPEMNKWFLSNVAKQEEVDNLIRSAELTETLQNVSLSD